MALRQSTKHIRNNHHRQKNTTITKEGLRWTLAGKKENQTRKLQQKNKTYRKKKLGTAALIII